MLSLLFNRIGRSIVTCKMSFDSMNRPRAQIMGKLSVLPDANSRLHVIRLWGTSVIVRMLYGNWSACVLEASRRCGSENS